MINNILYAHDHKFISDGAGRFYSHGAYPGEFWNRFLTSAKTVSVLGRDGGVDENVSSRFVCSSHDRVRFNLIDSIPMAWRAGFYRGELFNLVGDLVNKADAVVVRLPSELGLAVVSHAKKKNKKILVEVVGCGIDAYRYRGDIFGKLYAGFIGGRIRSAVKEAAGVLYVAKYLKDRYPPQASASTVICTNAVLNDVLDNSIAKEKVFKFRSKKIIKIGLIGSFSTKYKGVDVAIRAMSELARNDVHLHILGEGDVDFYANLAKQLNVLDLIHFDGIVPAGSAVMSWLDQCDIYIQPSYTEGLPRGLIESMSRGIPSLGSSAGGIPELLPESRLHTPGDAKKLAMDIEGIIENYSEAECIDALKKARSYLFSIIDAKRKEYYEGGLT